MDTRIYVKVEMNKLVNRSTCDTIMTFNGNRIRERLYMGRSHLKKGLNQMAVDESVAVGARVYESCHMISCACLGKDTREIHGVTTN